ncbi:zinc finger BED domain-containing protein RICESLEEPER 2-like [Punica granatum]|nr:zinc finger BED domain-containing protein RICESLEEPER 2-like [Punica granatum]XP_031384247.1 zinc finger BED domain-containing protein RICESLEEPER 2-like [Punica granatum]
MDLSDAVMFNSSRLKSVVWNDFDRVKKGDNLMAICKHCKKRMSGSGTSGTSHLRNHLMRCQRRGNHDIVQFASRGKKRGRPPALGNTSFNQDPKEEISPLAVIKPDDPIKDETVPVTALTSNFDQRRSQFDLARMIILHGYPLNMVEHIGFRRFVKNVQPLFELASSNKVEADCLEIYEKEKQKLFEMLDKLPGKISLALDVWSSSDDSLYFSLISHFIDDSWQLKKKILSFLKIDSSNTEDMQADSIMTCLMDWDIDRKLFSVTSDGSSTNTIVSRIKDRLMQNRFLFGNGQLFDVQCLASLLNLMVQHAMEALHEVIPKVRGSIRYVKSSRVMQEKFKQMTQRENIEGPKCLSLDNRLRWDSTYRMLEAALVYKGAFALLRENDPKFISWPSDVEWEKVGSVTGFLNVFLDIMNDFSRSKCPTANIYFPLICDIHLKLISWCESSDEFISSLAMKMRNEFDDYWERCSLGLAVAVFLDPRFKMKLVEYYFPQIYGSGAQERINNISNHIKALYNEHSIGSPLASADHCLAWQVDGSSGGISSPGSSSSNRLVGFEKFLNETSQSDGAKTDLDKYLEEPLFPRNVDFNVLNWWKVHTPRYPILSMMARNVLGIQMSKVSSESAFDLMGKILERDRSSLGAATLQALMCSQDWIGSELES